jgi:hypothetical protein
MARLASNSAATSAPPMHHTLAFLAFNPASKSRRGSCPAKSVGKHGVQNMTFFFQALGKKSPAHITTVSTARSRFLPPTDISIPSSQMRS